MKINNIHLFANEMFKKGMNTSEVAAELDISVGLAHKSKNEEFNKVEKIERAIIWAAGWGSRLMPVTKELPKPLVVVKGMSMVESNIKALHRSGIKDITIVLGREAEAFDTMVKKYKLKVIANTKWQKHNNISSFYAAISKMKGSTYLIDADLVFSTDFEFKTNIINSYMVTGKKDDIQDLSIKKTGSWVTNYVNGKKSENVESGEQYKGVFCLRYDDLKKLILEVKNTYDINAEYNDKYWFDPLFDLCKSRDIKMETLSVEFEDIMEIDTIEDLLSVDKLTYISKSYIKEKYDK